MPSVTIRVDYTPNPDAAGVEPSIIDAAHVVLWHVDPEAVCPDPYAVTIDAAVLVGTACPVCTANVPLEVTACAACGHTVGIRI